MTPNEERIERIVFTVLIIFTAYAFYWLCDAAYGIIIDGLRKVLVQF